MTYEQDRVTPENLDAFLSASVGDGDLLLDLAWNIDNPTILQWCRDHGVRYLNTSVELWDPVRRHERRRIRSTARCTCATWTCADDGRAGRDNKGATAVVEHGANPGLVSHFTKQALIEIATAHARATASPTTPPGARASAAPTRTYATRWRC